VIEDNSTYVSAAFEILLEELEQEIERINAHGSQAFAGRAYDRAGEVLNQVTRLTAFRDKVATLHKEWGTLLPAPAASPPLPAAPGTTRSDSQPRLTRDEAFYRPILQILDTMGGSGRGNEVLARLEQVMKDVLTPDDRVPIASDSDTQRWQKAAVWARWRMVRDGLLQSSSPPGLCEITEAGRRYLSPPTAAAAVPPRPAATPTAPLTAAAAVPPRPAATPTPAQHKPSGPREDFGRVPADLITARESYYRPILQALVDLGGRARARAVLDRVGRVMKPIHTPTDYAPLPSHPQAESRWVNRAHWARYDMVKDGRMKPDSSFGIWEISDEGRRWLAQTRT